MFPVTWASMADRDQPAAQQHGLEYLKDQYEAPEAEPESLESQLHIVYSLARWLMFYGSRGHGYEADF